MEITSNPYLSLLQIVMKLAGYTMGRADLVRRAMSKKKAYVMEKERSNFVYGNTEEHIEGCIKRGISEQTAHKIYDDMVDFAKYAFNKSHAAAYSVITYQTAWLKYHYPAEYMASVMDVSKNTNGRIGKNLAECRRMKLNVLPPDINESGYHFREEGNSIRYGFCAIRSMGEAGKEIEEERNQNGPYRNLSDLVTRTMADSSVLTSLVVSGAFDFCYKGKRSEIAEALKTEGKTKGKLSLLVAQLRKCLKKKTEENAVSDAEKAEACAKEIEELIGAMHGEKNDIHALFVEKEYLGAFLTEHPMESCMQIYADDGVMNTADFHPGKNRTMAGIVNDLRVVVKPGKRPMYFFILEDLYGSVSCSVFGQSGENAKNLLYEGAMVMISGNAEAQITEDDNGEVTSEEFRMNVKAVKKIDMEEKSVYLCVDDRCVFVRKDVQDFLKQYIVRNGYRCVVYNRQTGLFHDPARIRARVSARILADTDKAPEGLIIAEDLI